MRQAVRKGDVGATKADLPSRELTYIQRIGELLRPQSKRAPLVLDLFAGPGGLALGFEAQGFETQGFEIDTICCATYRRNLKGECRQLLITPGTAFPAAPVVIAGPPCQPFSVGGNQNGLRDVRDGFPSCVAAISNLRPEIFLLENVRGLLYRSKGYLEETVGSLRSLGYIVEVRLLNAVHYDVPQRRERLFIVGHKGRFTWPEPVNRVITAGEALGDLPLQAPPESKFLTVSMDAYVARYEKASACKRPRDLDLERPARTLTCRNLAGATGDMQRVRLADGRRRRLLVREAARLQSFPDWFEFMGSGTSQFDLIGNAVPPMMSYHLAASVRAYLESDWRMSSTEIEERNRSNLQLSLL